MGVGETRAAGTEARGGRPSRGRLGGSGSGGWGAGQRVTGVPASLSLELHSPSISTAALSN